MSKGEEKQQKVSIRQSAEEYFHQCQRGRLLEILSLMAKDMAKELSSKCSREEQKECIYSLSYRAAVSVKETGTKRL